MKSAALLLISFFFFLQTYFSTPGEFSNKDLFFIAVFSCAVFLVQFIVMRICKNIIINNIVFSIFVFINIYCLHLLLIPGFSNLSWIYLSGLALLGLFVLFTLAKIIEETKFGGLAFVIFGLAACVMITFNNHNSLSIFSAKDKMALSKKATMPSQKNFDFQKKPNVYFISFDSLIPKALMAKYMGVDNNPYHDVLDKNFRKFRNVFADAVSTKRSLNALLALDPDYFRELESSGSGDHLGMYTGMAPSPLFEIFSQNGYTTNTLFNSRYFGPKKGEFLDNYWINRDVSVCDFLDRKTAAFSFFGYCRVNNPNVFNKPNVFNQFLSKFSEEEEKPDPVSFLLSSMQAGLDKNKPQLFVAYVYSPGHTKMTYQTGNEKDLDEYKQKNAKNSEAAVQQITSIVSFLEKNDPEGILVLFGDHGPWLSRSVSLEEDPQFFIQDRYGVYGGIYPKKACKDHLQHDDSKQFTTISKLAWGVLGCLSNNKSSDLLEKPFFPIFKEKTNVRYKYENFLYE